MTTLFLSHSSKDEDWALEIREALRSQGYQSLFLDLHPDDGIRAGEEWEKTLYYRLRQSRALVVLCTANWLSSPWCVAEASPFASFHGALRALNETAIAV